MLLTVKLKGGSSFDVDLTKEIVYLNSRALKVMNDRSGIIREATDAIYDLTIPVCMIEGFVYKEGEQNE